MFFTGASQTWDDGASKVVHGWQGEVTGAAAHESAKGKGVHVSFPGNTGPREVCCFLQQVCRAAPASCHALLPPHTRGATNTRPERTNERPFSRWLPLPRRFTAPAVGLVSAAARAQRPRSGGDVWWRQSWSAGGGWQRRGAEAGSTRGGVECGGGRWLLT